MARRQIAVNPVIASEAKQSSRQELDCFVASAPRNDGESGANLRVGRRSCAVPTIHDTAVILRRSPLTASLEDGPRALFHPTPRKGAAPRMTADVRRITRPGRTFGAFAEIACAGSSGPRSASSHSRHSTSSRSAPPWRTSAPRCRRAPRRDEIRSRAVQARSPAASRSMLRDLQDSTRSNRSAAISRRGCGFAGQRLLPVEPVHADHQPLLALPPDDVAGLHVRVLHMRRNHREIVGIEGNQLALRRHRKHLEKSTR